MIEDLNNLSKQFTREWELCKLTSDTSGRMREATPPPREREMAAWDDYLSD